MDQKNLKLGQTPKNLFPEVKTSNMIVKSSEIGVQTYSMSQFHLK
jgi:hypothetical protein